MTYEERDYFGEVTEIQTRVYRIHIAELSKQMSKAFRQAFRMIESMNDADS